MPTRRTNLRLLLTAAAALLLLAPSTASAEDLYRATYSGGEVVISVNDQFTAATIQKLTFGFDECGTDPEEASCSWEVKGVLTSDPETRCSPATPASQVVFSSGRQAGNGFFPAPATTFPLEGCRGQVFTLSYRFDKTYEPHEGEGEPPTLRITGGGGFLTSFKLGFHPLEEAEEGIRNASPPATPPPPRLPPTFTVSTDCRSLTIDSTRYDFSFRQMGCRKARNLARMRHVSGAAPDGYACKRRSGGSRCWRQGKQGKYVQWTLPR